MTVRTVSRWAPEALVSRLVWMLAALAATCAAAGLLLGGGPGRQVAETYRGESVTTYGEGVYAWDTWLVGAGNRGQDLVVLLVEVPLLLTVLWWFRRGGAVPPVVLTGVLAFFTYLYASMVFATAQNRLFPLYVAAAAVSGFALVAVATRLDAHAVAAVVPPRPGRGALTAYLVAVATALTAAWLPGMLTTAVTGDVAHVVGPYTSAATEALDLGVVVPVFVLALVLLRRGAAEGLTLTLVLLVMNVCIGILLLGQGVSQLESGVPLTVGEIVVKMLTFAVLTFVAGGLLTRMWFARGGGDEGTGRLRVDVRQHRGGGAGGRGGTARVDGGRGG